MFYISSFAAYLLKFKAFDSDSDSDSDGILEILKPKLSRINPFDLIG